MTFNAALGCVLMTLAASVAVALVGAYHGWKNMLGGLAVSVGVLLAASAVNRFAVAPQNLPDQDEGAVDSGDDADADDSDTAATPTGR